MNEDAPGREAAIAAFDEANLAWGRFRLETLPRFPAARRAAVDEVRDALGEAAISAAELLEGDAPAGLRAALAEALSLLDEYSASLPPDVPRDDLAAARVLLAEAVRHLTPYPLSG